MSLIEQAAKRLEQLKRAGASTADPAGSAAQVAVAEPVPEALVAALEKRAELTRQVAEPQRRSAGAAPSTAPGGQGLPGPKRPPTRPKGPPRHAHIDVERLKQRGFVTPAAPTSQIADEFRVIKRPVIRNALNRLPGQTRHPNLVMVTSAVPGEGKTFTALNLAISIAMEYDNTALLVDGDVAHPAMPRLLGIPQTPGLMDLLTDETLDVGDALVRTNIDKLSVLPAGSENRRATEMLASEQMSALLDELASRYADRIIVFDSPPLLPTTEARVLANHMGQVIVVVAAESTSRTTVNNALSTIESCDVVMMLLNKASRTEVGSYNYYSGDGDT